MSGGESLSGDDPAEVGADRGPDPGDEPDHDTPGRAEPLDARVGEGLLDHEMGPSGAMAHLYRGEIHRMKLWRERLDKTTNWAVLLIAAVLTWAFSSEANPHYVILVGHAAVVMFLFIEARRYRAYDVWRSRVRKLQEHVWAVGLDPEIDLRETEWREKLATDYRSPRLKISTEEAIAHRLRRVYIPIFTVLNGAWLLRVTAFAGTDWPASAAVGTIPGTVVTGIAGVLYVVALVVCYRPRTWHTRGELLAEELRENGD
ncbi:DUF2270 domain-containing protein [Halorientalis sp.]|jgi:uncharacterized membrane protein|uniref:DUF2270 domain-containing protein n=1 Tax=Halorientalis sp. TaxID=1931229 RepID=UPI0026099804|nr:DUF2270 domain-containing protein [Halorientalis sp.]